MRESEEKENNDNRKILQQENYIISRTSNLFFVVGWGGEGLTFLCGFFEISHKKDMPIKFFHDPTFIFCTLIDKM